MLITFEGLDCSGKTTILGLVNEFLNSLNVDFITTREPGSNNIVNKKIRKIILDKNHPISPMTEALLYGVDRRENLETNIWPSLEQNKIVICDRYLDSSLAYQGFGRELGYKKILSFQKTITNNTTPDLTIFFDIPVEVSIQRSEEKIEKDRLENEDKEFKKRVYDGYQYIIKKQKKRFKVVDAKKTIEEVFADVKSILIKSLKLEV